MFNYNLVKSKSIYKIDEQSHSKQINSKHHLQLPLQRTSKTNQQQTPAGTFSPLLQHQQHLQTPRSIPQDLLQHPQIPRQQRTKHNQR